MHRKRHRFGQRIKVTRVKPLANREAINMGDLQLYVNLARSRGTRSLGPWLDSGRGFLRPLSVIVFTRQSLAVVQIPRKSVDPLDLMT